MEDDERHPGLFHTLTIRTFRGGAFTKIDRYILGNVLSKNVFIFHLEIRSNFCPGRFSKTDS